MSFAELVRLRGELLAEILPADADTIVALRLPHASGYHLGRSNVGELCALIETTATTSSIDVRLRNLEVRHGVRCHIRDPRAAEFEVQGSLIVCRTSQATLIDLFLRLYADAIEDLGPSPSAAAVARWLQSLATLLSRLEQDARRTLPGLWAELFVMFELGDPSLLLRRWHADPREHFDFLGSGFALEVKSCQDFDRVHEFSLDQLRPPPGLTAWVASIVVRRDPAGVSVVELAALIEAQLTERKQRALLRDLMLATGGVALEDDDDYRFDLPTAIASLRLLDVADVPCFREAVPAGVVAVMLRVHCAEVGQVGFRQDALERLR